LGIIRSNRIAAVIFAVGLIGIGASAFAQGQMLPRDLYNRALSELQRGAYTAAQTDFEAYADRYAASPAKGAALLGAIKASVYGGDYETTLQLTDDYLKAYAGNPNCALAYLYRGHAYLALYNLDEALRAYSESWDASGAWQIRSALEAVTKQVAGEVPLSEARKLLDVPMTTGLEVPLWNAVAQRTEQAGQRYQAAQIYRRLADRYTSTPAGNAARTHQQNLERALANTVRVGVLVPMTGNLAAYGEDLRRGVELAADLYSDSSGREVELLPEDTKGDPVAATRACQSVLEQDPLAMVGPLLSTSAIGCAAATACAGVPLVVPAATETGLSNLGDGVYCLTPPVGVYGQTLGSYAVEKLQLCSHMILAPDDAWGHEIAADYRAAVEDAGGYIWYEAFYTPGITDFGPYLRKFKASFLDTLSDTSWFYAPDSTALDWEEITVYPDAIFTPGYAEDLILLLPQIRFYKIAGRLIGTDAFGDEDVLMRIGPNLEDAIFASVQPLVEGYLEWKTFESRFARKYGHNPNRMSALGYDAFRLMIGGLGRSPLTPETLERYLHGVSEFDGAAGPVRFSTRGENSSVPVYYITNGKPASALR